MKIGIRQISERSGFSISTVSNVLNRKGNANKETAQAILQIAEELGYRQTNTVKTIKLVLCKRWGEILGDTPFFTALIEGIHNGCKAYGFPLEVCSIDLNGPELERDIQSLMMSKDSALLLLATEMDNLDLFNGIDIPFVVLDAWFPCMKYNTVTINNRDSAYSAVQYLLNHGHLEIGYIKSSISIKNFAERSFGFNLALNEAGVPLKKEYLVSVRPTSEGAYADMMAYLDQSPALASAYFADNDIIALGAMKAFRDHGYRLPEDVSIVGFDDIPYCDLASPSLTSVHVFKEDLGVAAVALLNSIINNPTDCVIHEEISTKLIERQSVNYKQKT